MCVKRSSITSLGENCRERKPAMRSVAVRSWSAETLSGFSSSGMTSGTAAERQTCFDNAGEHAGSNRQNFVVENVSRIVHGNRSVVSEPEISPGHGLQHVGKIFAAHFGTRSRHDLRGFDYGARNLGDEAGMFFVVHQHAEDVANVGCDLDLKSGGHAGAEAAHPVADEFT